MPYPTYRLYGNGGLSEHINFDLKIILWLNVNIIAYCIFYYRFNNI